MIHGRVAGGDINRRKKKGDYYGGDGGCGASVHCQGDQRVLERIPSWAILAIQRDPLRVRIKTQFVSTWFQHLCVNSILIS